MTVDTCIHVHVHDSAHTCTLYMMNTQTVEKGRARTMYKSNSRAATFQRKIAASGGN